MKKRKQLVTIDEAKPVKRQPKTVCGDCPFARASLRGWLGGMTPEEWMAEVHHPGDCVIDCHTRLGAQCVGAAVYRANIVKRPRPGSGLLEMPKDTETVFATPAEFLKHHKRSGE
jgi:hypothetical protein